MEGIDKSLVDEFMAKSNTGSETEYYASNEEFFVDCCRGNYLEEVQEVLREEEGLDIAYMDNHLNNAIHMASANGHEQIITAICEHLKSSGKEEMIKSMVNHQNSAGSTPLHWAVVNDKEGTVELLLSLGANAALFNSEGNNPLTEAIQLNRTKCSELIAPHVQVNLEEFKDLQDFQVHGEKVEDVSQEKET